MIRFGCACLIVLAAAGVVEAQKSAAADKQAASWFNNGRDAFLSRLSALQASDLDAWEAAAKNAGLQTTRRDLGLTLPKFNPLFDPKGQVVAGAVAKYAGRLGQLPKTAVDEWATLTGGESLVVSMSLTAENALFPGEKFGAAAFRAFAAKFK